MQDNKIVYLEGYRVSREAGDNEPRVRDVELAEKLGTRTKTLRDLVRRHAEELNDYGFLRTSRLNSGTRGRPQKEYWLNRDQALLVCTWAETQNARLVRKQIVRVISAVLDGRAPHGRCYIADVIRLEGPRDWEKLWPDDFTRAMCQLKGHPFTGVQPGGWMARVYADIYRCLFNDEVYDAIRELNPHPSHGSNHHQHLREAARERLRLEIHTVTAFAKTSVTYGEFLAKMHHHYNDAPMQLSFVSYAQ